MLRLRNTLTRKQEEFKPLEGNTVRMYACGPTVYDFGHIGNFRTFVAVDLISHPAARATPAISCVRPSKRALHWMNPCRVLPRGFLSHAYRTGTARACFRT